MLRQQVKQLLDYPLFSVPLRISFWYLANDDDIVHSTLQVTLHQRREYLFHHIVGQAHLVAEEVEEVRDLQQRL